MDDLYRDNLLDHYENPRHHGVLPQADGVFEDSNPLCGDKLHIEVKLSDDQNTLADAAFTGDGCIISQAAASMLLDDSINKLVTAIDQMEPQHVLKLIGVPLTAQRVKCALLSFKVLKGALADAKNQSQR
jgi:nitrogen fixation NifU-like protein